MDTTVRHVIKPRTPVRAFIIAAVLVLVGAVLVAVSAAQSAGAVWAALPAVLMVAGLALVGIAVASMVKMRTFVTVDDEGYRITGPGVDKQGTWVDVTRVTTSSNGSHLTLYHGEVGRTHILCPAGGDDPSMQALVADISRRLDDSRGYGETFNIPLIDPHNPDPDIVA